MDPLDGVRTITFDSYTTIVDVGAQRKVLAEQVDGIEDPGAVSRLWRSQTMMYSVIANDIGAYRPFSELQSLALRYALERFGHEVSAERRRRIREAAYVERLAVFEDVRPAMRRLAEAGYPLYVVSNGDPDMLEAMIAAAGLGELLEDAISADEVRTFKPDAEIYRHAAARTGTPIRRILHVSGGTMRDVWGAAHAGMRTAWVNRPAKPRPPEHLGAAPDLVVAGFQELVERLPDAAP